MPATSIAAGTPIPTALDIGSMIAYRAGQGRESGLTPSGGRTRSTPIYLLAQRPQRVQIDLGERGEGLDRVPQHIEPDARPDRECRLLQPFAGLGAERVRAGDALA